MYDLLEVICDLRESIFQILWLILRRSYLLFENRGEEANFAVSFWEEEAIFSESIFQTYFSEGEASYSLREQILRCILIWCKPELN